MQMRAATVADFAAIHAVRVAVRENRLSDPNRITQDDYRDMLQRDGTGWIIEVDGRIVAFGIADRTHRNIWALFVQPGYEGRGFGRRLLKTMTDWLCNEGCAVIWLTTDPGTRAESFYRAAGWTDAGLETNGERRFEWNCYTHGPFD